MKQLVFVFTSIFILTFPGMAQQYVVSGRVVGESTNQPFEQAVINVPGVNTRVETDSAGNYSLRLPPGKHRVQAFSIGMESVTKEINLVSNRKLNFTLQELSTDLDEVTIEDQRAVTNGITRLRSIEGFGIYEAKKNELIVLDDFAANKVNNNARQVFAKVPGLNIWESDYAGLQLDIAARGLGPSRTANFNTRQNGYDMSADALGYPESYYMPALQAVQEIVVVRGAASLQYGTQFGGMLNFNIREAPDKPFELNLEQAVASFGLINSFASVGGTVNKIDYYGYYQYRQGKGWRENSGFNSHLGFARIGYRPNDKMKIGVEYSLMEYSAQQPGGLTDADFNAGELEKSRRDRNWFRVSWNLLANTIDYKFSERTKVNVRTFGLFSGRDALGNLAQIDREDDPDSPRTLISDDFTNFGTEARLLHYYDVKNTTAALLVGGRFYRGLTNRKQGFASAAENADFSYLNPEDPEDFDYDFPNTNYSLFAENIWNPTQKLSITIGARYEYIRTDSEGTWKQRVQDRAGNIITENVFTEDRSVPRSFVLFGAGVSYYLNDELNVYANASENFRSVTFSDLRLNNPNFRLDSLITDESGYNADLGIRGKVTDWLNVDLSLFLLRYNNRIGLLLPERTTTLLRTNIGDSRHVGLESLVEVDLLKVFGYRADDASLSFFTNFSLIDARYIRSDDSSIKGKKVEYVPEVMLRTGLNYAWKDLKATAQLSYLGEQYSDATNSEFNANALNGIIPAYRVVDLSVEYAPDRYKFSFGVNNLTNEQYFTRRAISYPGPGIIPATPRSFYVAVGVRL